MMKLLIKIFSVFLIGLHASCAMQAEGAARGYEGEIRVKARLQGTRLLDYEILLINDSPPVTDRALPLLKKRILEAGHPMVDSISGASYTSYGVKNALARAMRKDPFGFLRLLFTKNTLRLPNTDSLRRERLWRLVFPKKQKGLSADVVVIGGGAAGIAAAISAREHPSRPSVLLIEKLDILGGNAKFTRNLYNMVPSQAQKAAGIKDSPEALAQDLCEGLSEKELLLYGGRIHAFAQGSSSLDGWLRARDIALDYLFGYRDHMAGENAYAGAAVTLGLERILEGSGVQTLRGTALTAFDFSRKTISAESKTTAFTIQAKAVVIAAGGFAANGDLVSLYDPSLEGWQSSGSAGNTGDLLLAAQKAGLPLSGMEQISVFPYALPTRELTGDSEDDTEYFLVNREGRRFVDEFEDPDLVRILSRNPGSFLIFDSISFRSSPRMRAHIQAGKGFQADDIRALAPALQVPPQNLEDALSVFQAEAPSKGRRPLQASFYALSVRPLIHMTRGGLRVDDLSRLLDAQNKPLPGIYAAGEVTDMPFAALAGALVFGIQAGGNAAAYSGGIYDHP